MKMKTCHVFVSFLLLVRSSLVESQQRNFNIFSWSNCGRDDPITVQSLTVQPDPIILPGIITISAKVSNQVDVSTLTKASVKVQKKMGTSWYDVPCVNGFGSCKYEDVCALLGQTIRREHDCPAALRQNNIPCNCPFLAGNYEIHNGNFDINIKLPAEVINGDYHLTAKLLGETRELACYDMWFGLRAA